MHKAVCIAAALLILPCQAQARHLHSTHLHRSYVHHAHLQYTYVGRAEVRRAYAYRAYGLRNFRQAYASVGRPSVDGSSFDRTSWGGASVASSFDASERVIGHRPSGCPNRFCGCEASLYRFGRIIPELNLASNWRRFPRAAAAPGMAAVRSGHVMILQSQVSGNVWNVHDGNSGGHVTREHARSLAGYTIVDPGAVSAGLMSGSHGRFM